MRPSPTQLFFPGFVRPEEPLSAARPARLDADRPPDQLFFGILLDAAAAYVARQRALRIQSQHHLKRPRPTRLLHVTLRGLGDVTGLSEGLIETAARAAATVEMPPFEVEFDRVTHWKQAVVLVGGDGVSGLRQLEHALGEALAAAGLARGSNRPFNPHITLIYDDTVVPDHMIRPLHWKIREFTLVESLVTRSKYITHGTFPLRG